jgi:hypothetical protein
MDHRYQHMKLRSDKLTTLTLLRQLTAMAYLIYLLLQMLTV